MSTITLKIDKELLEKVKIIVQKKKPLRNISKYAEAAREVLIEYVKINEKNTTISNLT